MNSIMNGQETDEQIERFLVTLADRGETAEEICGAAKVLRAKALMIKAPDNAADCCGTGGDASGTYNISTAVAFVAAACGIPMAKHGNRASSSKSGAGDVLEALGVNLEVPVPALGKGLVEFNFAFLMAPHHHQAMKYVMPVRKALKRRTLFNLLGPLINPAVVQNQLLGVFHPNLIPLMAETLQKLGTKRAWVVCGEYDGGFLDEVSLSGPTHCAIVNGNNPIETKILSPEMLQMPTYPIEAIQGGDAKLNATALRNVLNGSDNAYRDVVLVNTAALLCVCNADLNLAQAIDKARKAIDSEKALHVLEDYAAFTRSFAQNEAAHG